jgi:LPS-assembly lipoprotein
MSSSSLRTSFLAFGIAAAVALSGCSSLRPVYGDAGIGAERLALYYAKPASRLEQIITQDLIVRLGSTDDASAPTFSVVATTSKRQLTRTNVTKPATQWEIRVDAKYVVTSGGKPIAQGSRQATAGYSASGQVLADEAAIKDATERAGHAVADTIRLSILGALSQPAAGAGAAQ